MGSCVWSASEAAVAEARGAQGFPGAQKMRGWLCLLQEPVEKTHAGIPGSCPAPLAFCGPFCWNPEHSAVAQSCVDTPGSGVGVGVLCK